MSSNQAGLPVTMRVDPVIEGFRGLAALMVLSHHYSYALESQSGLSLAWLHFFHNGVDLFFVISGFLFAAYLLGEVSLRPLAFMIRRAFRLYPLYLISLAIGGLTLWCEKKDFMLELIKHIFFLQALPIFSLAKVSFFSLIYWTLPVEVAFYGLVMLLLVCPADKLTPVASIGRSKNQRFIYLGVFSIVCFLFTYGWKLDMQSESWVLRQAQLPALLLEFWFGIALHRLLLEVSLSRACFVLLLSLGLLLLVLLMLRYSQIAQISLTARPFGFFNVLSAFGYACILGGCLGLYRLRQSQIASCNSLCSICYFLGAISYGSYLFHEWSIEILSKYSHILSPGVKVVSAFMVTIVLATVMHLLIEKPCRQFGRRLATRSVFKEAKGNACST